MLKFSVPVTLTEHYHADIEVRATSEFAAKEEVYNMLKFTKFGEKYDGHATPQHYAAIPWEWASAETFIVEDDIETKDEKSNAKIGFRSTKINNDEYYERECDNG